MTLKPDTERIINEEIAHNEEMILTRGEKEKGKSVGYIMSRLQRRTRTPIHVQEASDRIVEEVDKVLKEPTEETIDVEDELVVEEEKDIADEILDGE